MSKVPLSALHCMPIHTIQTLQYSIKTAKKVCNHNIQVGLKDDRQQYSSMVRPVAIAAIFSGYILYLIQHIFIVVATSKPTFIILELHSYFNWWYKNLELRTSKFYHRPCFYLVNLDQSMWSIISQAHCGPMGARQA